MTVVESPIEPSPNLNSDVLATRTARALESEVRSYSRRISATFATADGSTITDSDGRQYLDFLSGCSALNYGHNDPDMAAALVEYVTSFGVAHGMDLQTTARNEFLAAVQGLLLTPRGLDYRVQFTGPTGTNAVEAAMKLARKVTGRTNIVAFTNGFHGVTAGALAATGNQGHRMAPFVPLPGVSRAPFDGYLGPDVNTAAVLDKFLSDPSSGFDPPAAILLETVQSEGGLNTASTAWLQEVRAIADKHGALLIIDDIQAGCGRTGTFFSFEPAQIVPDIVTLSKSLSGFGLPMSIVLMRPEHDQWSPGEHNGTFRGNNLAFVTATIALTKYWGDNRLADAIAANSVTMTGALQRLASSLSGAQVKGRGMLVGIETHDTSLASEITGQCFERGLILETAGPLDTVVKLLPPLTITTDDLDAGLDILSSVVQTTQR